MKSCSKCKLSKEKNNFAKQPRAKDQLQSICKVCQAEATRKWYQENKEYCREKRYDRYKKNQERDNETVRRFLKKNPGKTKEYHLRAKFGIEKEQFNKMLTEQNNSCDICNNEFTKTLLASVDHNHSSGKVRGLLCGQCNTGIGLLKENEQTLLNAIEYLRKHTK